MKPDLVQINYEVKSLATMVTDRSAIAKHINAVHGVNYFASDIEKIMLGLKPSGSIMRNPQAVRTSKLMAEPIAWARPISTNVGGVDPLAVATNAYLAKYSGKIREALAA
jgi:hypothetical protein